MTDNKITEIESWPINWQWEANSEKNAIANINRNYKIIYNIFFKYWILIIIIIIAIIFFLSVIGNKKILSSNNDLNSQKDLLIKNYERNRNDLKELEDINPDIKIKIKQWTLDISENIILSYDNLLSYKWLTMPRWTFLYEPDKIKDNSYFSNWDYDVNEINNFINNVIFVDYDAISKKSTETNTLIKLENNSINDTFFISCATRPRLFNNICNNFINDFINNFFVYDISKDIPWLLPVLRTLVSNEKYSVQTCESLNKYFIYSNTAPSQFEDIIILCWWSYMDNYYLLQDFIGIKEDLENKQIKSNLSRYSDINDYKLISYQQILYNNLNQWIPPNEWMYKEYINFLINILKKTSSYPINSFYFDTTYRFNNLYLIPSLNWLKYQSTTTKKNEIESIITDLEKINNGNSIDWYIWLKYTLTNKWLEEDIKKVWSNLNSTREDTMSILLKGIKNLSYLKLINDEIDGNTLKINWYLDVEIHGNSVPIYFWAILENKNWNLVVNEIIINEHDELTDILWIITKQQDLSLWEVYEYIGNNIGLYISENYNITPCDILENNLNQQNFVFEILLCNENKINIVKWESWNKILYQFKMDKYNINSISSSNKSLEKEINEKFNLNTNSVNIWNTVANIVAYEQEVPEISETLEWNNNVIIAIEDFKTYLWVNILDIAEENGKVAAEFIINTVNFIGIYDTNTKKLWPLFLKQWAENNYDVNFKQFSLYLTPENQNEINRFLIETFSYLYEVDKFLAVKYLSTIFENLVD